MAEEKFIVFDKNFTYGGLLSVSGLYRAARTFLESNDYSPYESRHEEQVFPDGKEILVELKGVRDLSDNASIRFETILQFTDITEQRVELDGKKVRMNKGSVSVTSRVILATDWMNTYEQKAFMYFIRVLIDKFIFKSYIYRAEKEAKKDYSRFEDELKRYLNMKEFR